jgi:DNA-binding transcriptional LysR family regulator
MLNVNEFLNTSPFDLYELSLFQLVAKSRSFTKAAQAAGLTQSAITRQIQGMESSLGVDLLERTTRTVRLTKPGEFLFQESVRLLGEVDQSLRRLKEDFTNARKEIRVGVSRSISLAHLPGLFHANLRHNPKVVCHVAYQTSVEILAALEANELDLGVICPPAQLPRTLSLTHHFKDAFTLIAPAELASQFAALPKSSNDINTWLTRQPWLLIEENTNTGKQLRKWMARSGLKIEPMMQLDSFDLIINLVSLGMGIGLVPMRALALYGHKKVLVRLPLPERFEREVSVVMRRNRKQPQQVVEFVKNILF